MKIQKPLEFLGESSSRLPVTLLYGNNLSLQQFYLDCLRASFPELAYTTIESIKQLGIVTAPSLFDEEGSGKFIYLAGAGERDLAVFQSLVETPPHLLVVASSLPSKSKLVSYFLAHKKHAAFPCYDLRPQDLKEFISQTALKRGMTLAPETLLFLAETFVAHPNLLLSELDKLFLYQASQETPLNLKTAQSLINFNNQLNLGSLIQALLLKDPSLLLRALSFPLIEDEFMLIIRSLIKNYCQLFEVLTHLQQKISFTAALQQVSTPVFFQLKPVFEQAAERWSLEQCAGALERLLLLENAYKNQEVSWATVQARLLAIAER
jgi:DNA polymerase III delta subunit